MSTIEIEVKYIDLDGEQKSEIQSVFEESGDVERAMALAKLKVKNFSTDRDPDSSSKAPEIEFISSTQVLGHEEKS